MSQVIDRVLIMKIEEGECVVQEWIDGSMEGLSIVYDGQCYHQTLYLAINNCSASCSSRVNHSNFCVGIVG